MEKFSKNTRLFYKRHFLSNPRLKLSYQAKAKQHPEAELLVFENYSLPWSRLSSKTNLKYSKKCVQNEIIWLIMSTTKSWIHPRPSTISHNFTATTNDHPWPVMISLLPPKASHSFTPTPHDHPQPAITLLALPTTTHDQP